MRLFGCAGVYVRPLQAATAVVVGPSARTVVLGPTRGQPAGVLPSRQRRRLGKLSSTGCGRKEPRNLPKPGRNLPRRKAGRLLEQGSSKTKLKTIVGTGLYPSSPYGTAGPLGSCTSRCSPSTAASDDEVPRRLGLMGPAAETRSSRVGQVPGSVDLGELAQRLGVSGRTVRAWRWRGELPPPRDGTRRRPRWSWPEIESWARETGLL